MRRAHRDHAQESDVFKLIGLSAGWGRLAFPLQLCIGSAVPFLACVIGRQSEEGSLVPAR